MLVSDCCFINVFSLLWHMHCVKGLWLPGARIIWIVYVQSPRSTTIPNAFAFQISKKGAALNNAHTQETFVSYLDYMDMYNFNLTVFAFLNFWSQACHFLHHIFSYDIKISSSFNFSKNFVVSKFWQHLNYIQILA